MSWIDRITTSTASQAVEMTARFAEARHRVLAENVANIDTPGYRTKTLDPDAFEASLRAAIDGVESAPEGQLILRDNSQFESNSDGSIRVQPAITDSDSVLLHDGTNAPLEKLMTDTNANSQTYELALNLLRTRFEGLLRAIRGRTT